MNEKKKDMTGKTISFMVIVPDDIPQSDIGTIFSRLQSNFKEYNWVLRSEAFDQGS